MNQLTGFSKFGNVISEEWNTRCCGYAIIEGGYHETQLEKDHAAGMCHGIVLGVQHDSVCREPADYFVVRGQREGVS